MKAIVVGAKGMLGTDVCRALEAKGALAVGLDLPDFDALDPRCLSRLSDYPDAGWIVNCAAYTAVDAAESDSAQAHLLNGTLPRLLGETCARTGKRLLHISTDFVFDGASDKCYKETDYTNPLSVYGASKLEGEIRALKADSSCVVCRTAWLFGPNGRSFPRTILRAWKNGAALKVVSDQVGCPTYTKELAKTLLAMMESDPPSGIYHTVGTDACSWHELAVSVLQAAHDAGWDGPWPVQIGGITSDEWPTPAARPKNSRLCTQKVKNLGVPNMAHLQNIWPDFLGSLSPDKL